MQPPSQTELEQAPRVPDPEIRVSASLGTPAEGDSQACEMRLLAKEPPLKKLKTADPPYPLPTVDSTYPSKPWKLRAVLGDVATLPIPLVPALAAQISDKKLTSKLIKKLNEVLPLPNLQHLKRVKSVKEGSETRIYLLLWSIDNHCDIDDTLVRNKLADAGIDVAAFSRVFRREHVAKFAPLTRTQFEELKSQASYWPCNFHEDKYLESLVTSTHELWAQDNRNIQAEHMQRALLAGPGGGGGVVVDPSSNTVIAEGHGTPGHPLHHVVINLVDLVARSQGGGALEHTSRLPTFKFARSNGVKLDQDQPPIQEEQILQDKPTTSHNHLRRHGSIAQLSTVPKTGPYLCTGYDVYLVREPCHLCSMALIHMRTRRVFYSRPSRDGALGSCDKIHTLEGLNHRYEVFTGILSDPGHPLEDCC